MLFPLVESMRFFEMEQMVLEFMYRRLAEEDSN